MPKVAIIIIHYNTPKFLKTCLDAIYRQTYQNIEIFFIDNNSPDKTGLDFVRKNYGFHPNIRIIENGENLGYAGAANQGIKLAIEGLEPADYVVITNPDIIYTPEYFAKIIPRIEKDSHIAAIIGKVYKYDFSARKETKIIDTVGLFAYRNRRVIDDGQGLMDSGQFNTEREVFGVSGACPLYRREALEDAKIFDEYLDNDFFMYKEDVDLSWRFLLFGWKSIYFPAAVAYHGRGTGIEKRFFLKDIVRKRSKLSKFQKQYSFRNQLLMEAKNELFGSFLRGFFPIIFRKILTLIYITLREPFLWKWYFGYLKLLPKIRRKRRVIMAKKKVGSREMDSWFKKQSGYLNGIQS